MNESTLNTYSNGLGKPPPLLDAIRKLSTAQRLPLEDIVARLDEPWLTFWSERMSVHVSQEGEGSTKTPGVPLRDLFEDRPSFCSRLYRGERGVRRIERAIDFHAFLEDTSYTDFRNNVQQQIDRLTADLRDCESIGQDIETTLRELHQFLEANTDKEETADSQEANEVLRSIATALRARQQVASAKGASPGQARQSTFLISTGDVPGNQVQRLAAAWSRMNEDKDLRGALTFIAEALGDEYSQAKATLSAGRALHSKAERWTVSDVATVSELLEVTVDLTRLTAARKKRNLLRHVKHLAGLAEDHWPIATVYARPWKDVEKYGPVGISQRRAEELRRTLFGDRLLISFFDRIRTIHEDVQARWGTWTRRIVKPLKWSAISLVALIGAYRIAGAYTGVGALGYAVPVLVAAAFCISYKIAEGRIRKGPGRLKDDLVDLLPPADLKENQITAANYWRLDSPNDPKEIMGAIRRRFFEPVRPRTRQKLRERYPAILVLQWAAFFAAACCWLTWAPGFVWQRWVPPDAHILGTGDGACKEVSGKLTWPGPWVVSGLDSKGREFALDRARVLSIAYGSGVPSACPKSSAPMVFATLPAAASAPSQWAPLLSQGIRSAMVIPFSTDTVKTCDPAELRNQPATEPRDKKMVSSIGSFLAQCSQNRPAIIDVRGYASSRDFQCKLDSAALNRQLAEARRQSVIEILDAVPGFSGRVDVYKRGVPRFSAGESYSTFEFYDRPFTTQWPPKELEAFSRRVEIELLYAGDCAYPPQPPNNSK